MWKPLSHKILFLAVTVALVAGAAAACGQWFPNTVLSDGDRELLSAPVADFHRELARIDPREPPHCHAKPPERDVYRQTTDAGLADLRAALAVADTARGDRERIEADYLRLRQQLSKLARDQAYRRQHGVWAYGMQPAARPDLTVPAGLPGEFADYLRGAIAYHQNRMDAARASWTALLARPRAQRRYRTTWALFMIGKSCLDWYPDTAIPWFRRVRSAAVAGFPDSLGLAAASFGWEAKAYLQCKQYDKAIELYLLQHATGDKSAAVSLLWTASAALSAGPEALAGLAGEVRVRRVITAYLISKGGPGYHSIVPRPDNADVAAWLAALDAAGASDVTEAARLAWAAYQGGKFDIAWRWLKLAPAEDRIAQWTRAKLLLRAGKTDEAAAVLAKAVRGFPVTETWRVYGRGTSVWRPGSGAGGELALLCLSRGQYSRALDLLLRAGLRTDAGFVAEYVLTPKELVAYVDHSFPGTMAEAYRPDEGGFDVLPGEELNMWAHDLRHLLARRLTRIGRRKQARPYYPPKMRVVLDEYVAAIEAGGDKRRSALDRAESLWAAAKIARGQGMELLGTETPRPSDRSDSWPLVPGEMVWRRDGKLVPTSDDERRRVAAHGGGGENLYHYDNTASEHAWQAAELLADNTDRTARILCAAGTWLKNGNPKAAARFYTALGQRCGQTDLGRRANKLQSLPPLKDADKLALFGTLEDVEEE